MKLNCYQIDAFTDKTCRGNPACVVPLTNWLPDPTLLRIAQENGVAETAFFVHQKEKIHLRWFTPEIEMDLCGHATLATAHCLKALLNYPNNEITFETQSGEVTVAVRNQLYSLNFPARMPVASALPDIIARALNIAPQEVYKSRDYMLVYNTAQEIQQLNVDQTIFDQINLGTGGVIVTAKGESCDFVSRFFTPQASILEDPVTGSAHCSLVPFWSMRLGKNTLHAQQISERKGNLHCENKNERVIISGHATTSSIGHLRIE